MVSSSAMKRILAVLSTKDIRTVREIADKTGMNENYLETCLVEMESLKLVCRVRVDVDNRRGPKFRKGYRKSLHIAGSY